MAQKLLTSFFKRSASSSTKDSAEKPPKKRQRKDTPDQSDLVIVSEVDLPKPTCNPIKPQIKIEPQVKVKKQINSDTSKVSIPQPVKTTSRFQYSHSSPVKLDASVHNQFAKKLLGKTINESAIHRSKRRKKLTPLEKQFINLKTENMDKLLAVQVGYKYKFFGKDAQTASKILNIMYIPGRTSLDGSDDNGYDRFAYCSVPDVRLHVHLKRLLHRGLKVGVVEQKETAIMREGIGTSSSKLFERKLTHVYTSGTYIEDKDNQHSGCGGRSIVCIREQNIANKKSGIPLEIKFAMTAINAYSGEIIYDEFLDEYSRPALETRLVHLEPIEVIVVGEISSETKTCIEAYRRVLQAGSGLSGGSRLRLIHAKIDDDNDYASKLDSFGLKPEPISFIVSQSPFLQSCFCELMSYLSDFQLVSAFQIVSNYTDFSQIDKCMILDADTVRNLEIFRNLTTGTEQGTLFWILDHTHTPFGKRMLHRWISRPLNDRESILKRSGAIESISKHYGSIAVEKVASILKRCPDLEVSLSKIHYGRSKRKEVYLFLRKMDEIFECFHDLKDELINDVFNSPYLKQLYNELKRTSTSGITEFGKLFPMIYSPAAMDEKNEEDHVMKYFTDKFYAYSEIRTLKDECVVVEQQLDNQLSDIGDKLGRPHVRYITNNGEPYLVEVRNTRLKTVPKDWLKINGTKSVSRYRPPEVKKLYKKLLFNKECLREKCETLFKDFVSRIDSHYVLLSHVIKQLAVLDCLISLTVASSVTGTGYTRPKLVDEPIVDLKNSRNPIAETLKPGYIPNSFKATTTDGRVSIITGPNMGGKSSFMRQIALTVIMAQIGCYIPADRGSVLGIFDSILIRIGAYDDMFKGRSTFQVEMSECSTILRNCTDHSLVLLDEIGRGTSSIDGCAIAYSILHYLCYDKKPFVLFITHFQNLHVFENLTGGVAKNYHLGFVKNGTGRDYTLTFTYHLDPGASARSYGIYCARLAGFSREITDEATQISSKMERDWQNRQTLKIGEDVKKTLADNNFQNLWLAINEFDI